MKTILRISLFVTIMTALLFTTITPGSAQDVPPTPMPPLESGFVPFSALGESDILMRGPYDSADVRFTLPASWKLDAGASITLVLTAAFSSSEALDVRSSGASVRIDFNDVTIATLFLSEAGEQVVTIPIPLAALVTDRLDGRHVIDFSLDAAFDCIYPHETVVIIHAASVVELPHTLIPASADLAILPRPFYQQDSFLQKTSLLVIPENPTAEDLQAALTVSAAFGRMSAGELDLRLVTSNELTDDLLVNNHLIFVGDSDDVSSLAQQVDFPAVASRSGDGILRVAVSPWNSAQVVLQVSGVDETGLLKAAQALTFGIIQSGENVQTAVISNVNPAIAEPRVEISRTFADLGYLTQTVSNFGYNTLEYRFYMPPGYVPGNDSYLNLVYGHSALVDFSKSGVVVLLNDQRISSVSFAEETAAQLNTLKIPLYTEFLRPGDNRLVLQVNLHPVDICSAFSNRGIWFTVNSTSLVYLPLLPTQPSRTNMLINLSQYPYPFISSPTLGDVGFVLASNDVESWRAASQLASQLGRRATGQLLAPKLAFANMLSDEFLQNHLIVVGMPTQLSLIGQMADVMPAPFEPGSNMVTERTLTVEYRLPEGASLGFIELFTSPWNTERSVLAVLGSTPEGLGWAFNAMTDSSLRGRVTGNYVVVNRTQIFATDTRIGDATLIPDSDSTVPPNLVNIPAATTPVQGIPNWILPAIIIIFLLTVGVVALVVINSLRRVRK
jgi:cellulose synthase operon protein B